MPPTKRERRFPTICPRCDTKGCTGRFMLMTCNAEIDGLDGWHEGEQLLRDRYAPATDVADEVATDRPTLMECHYSTDILVPWVEEQDRRPRARGGPREGAKWVDRQGFTLPNGTTLGSGSAMHGECTECVKEAHDDHSKAIHAATWRRQNGPLPENFSYCKASYCDWHAKKHANAPIQVPEFANAEEAQAWLDKITQEREAG